MRPFCHLVITSVRDDSHPAEINGVPLCKMLVEKRLRENITQESLATSLGVSVGTIKNWEAGRTVPTRKAWPAVHQAFQSTNGT